MIISNKDKAFISWCISATASIAVLTLLYAWISDLQTPPSSSSSSSYYLSKSFLQNGFCLSPQLFNNTHSFCSIFDAFCGVCFIAAYLAGKLPSSSSSSSLGIASYFLAHSYGHYKASTMTTTTTTSSSEETMKLEEIITLSAILSIGPFSSSAFLVKAKKASSRTANTAAIIGLLSLVGVYVAFLRKPSHALLYINITILLASSLPKMCCVGYTSPEDIAIWSSGFHWATALTSAIVIGVVVCEPFFCDEFVAGAGGHFLFDASLALDAVASTLVAVKEEEKEDDDGGNGGGKKIKTK